MEAGVVRSDAGSGLAALLADQARLISGLRTALEEIRGNAQQQDRTQEERARLPFRRLPEVV